MWTSLRPGGDGLLQTDECPCLIARLARPPPRRLRSGPMGATTATSLRRAWFAMCALAVTVCAHAATSDAVHLAPAAPLLWIAVFAAAFAIGSRVPVRQFRIWRGTRVVALLAGTQIASHLVLGAAPWLVGLTTAAGSGHHHHEAAAVLDLRSLIVHIVAATIMTPLTGFLVYLGYKLILRRGYRSGIGFAAGTTAGNAIATPAIIAQADATFAPYVGTATAQVAASVLVTAILAPALASWMLKREGGLLTEEEIARIDAMDLGIDEPRL